jgi:hypothetical protein
LIDHLPSQTTILVNKYFDGEKLHGNADPQVSSDSTTLSSTSANAANTEVTESTGAAIIPEVTPGRTTTSPEPAASNASSAEDASTTTSTSNAADETQQLAKRMAEEKSSTAVTVKAATAETAQDTEVAVEKSPEASEAVQSANQAMENSKEASTVVQAEKKVSEAAETIQAEANIGAKTSEAAEDIQADIITSNTTPESMKAAEETSNKRHEVANAAQTNSKPESPANKEDNVLSSVITDRENQQIMVGPSAAGFEEKVAHLENMLRGVYAVAAEAGTEDAKEDAPAFEDAHSKGSQEPLIEVINLP